MAFFNQHSFTISALILVIIISVLLFRDGAQSNDFIALGALILGLVMAFLLFRPGESSLIIADEVVEQIGKDQPVLLEFQSNY
jgi:uncharacterized membrane protein YkvI